MISVETEILPYKISNFSCWVNLGLRKFSTFKITLLLVQTSVSKTTDMEYHTITLIFFKLEIILIKNAYFSISWFQSGILSKLEGNPCNMFKTTSYMLVYENYSSPELAGRKWQALLEFIISEIAEVDNHLNSLT